MSGSNIIHLDAYRPPDHREPVVQTGVHPVAPIFPADLAVRMGMAFWYSAMLLPVYVSLSVLDAWSECWKTDGKAWAPCTGRRFWSIPLPRRLPRDRLEFPESPTCPPAKLP